MSTLITPESDYGRTKSEQSGEQADTPVVHAAPDAVGDQQVATPRNAQVRPERVDERSILRDLHGEIVRVLDPPGEP